MSPISQPAHASVGRTNNSILWRVVAAAPSHALALKPEPECVRPPPGPLSLLPLVAPWTGRCLDHLVVLGQRHFDHLVKIWLDHYHTERPHQAKDNEVLSSNQRPEGAGRKGAVINQPTCPDLHCRAGRKGAVINQPTCPDVHCREQLGGLLKHYYRSTRWPR
jgi:hypothetical protein